MNKATFQELLTLLGELTNKKLSPAVRDYWWSRYGDLPADVIRTAFQAALDTCEFFPSPAAFNEILRDVSAQSGAVVDGASAWEAMDRTMFSCWSETNDRINVREHGYPWPDERCKQIIRNEMRRMVRDIAEMHPAEYAKTRERFIALYDGARVVEQAEATVAKIAAPAPLSVVAPPPLRRISGGGE